MKRYSGFPVLEYLREKYLAKLVKINFNHKYLINQFLYTNLCPKIRLK